MGRKRHQKSHEPSEQHQPDAMKRMAASSSNRFAIAIGPHVRVIESENQRFTSIRSLVKPDGLPLHSACIRATQFSPDGNLLMTACDDRIIRLWDVSSWTCIARWSSPKKVSAACFSHDSRYILFADKYGDVLVGDCSSELSSGPQSGSEPPLQKPTLLLGHLCSVVASIAVSPNNKLIATADKDRKIRISILPQDPMLGSVEIQSYCFGHTYFVSSCSWIGGSKLVTGGGDGTVRLWEGETGELLDTCTLSETLPDDDDEEEEEEGGDKAQGAEGDDAEAEAAEGDDEGDPDERIEVGPKCAPVLGVSCSKDGRLVVALVEGRDDVAVLRVDLDQKKLVLLTPSMLDTIEAGEKKETTAIAGVGFPSHAFFDYQDRIWVVGGAPINSSKSAHVRVVRWNGVNLEAITDEVIPASLLSSLELRDEEEERQVESGSLAPEYTKQFATYRRRYMTEEIIQASKRVRSDFQEIERLQELEKKHRESLKG